jgi:hypothetical protein
MPTTHITFAKLAANPTPTTWSLSYNAGNLFAAFSLKRTEESEETLSAQGKQITNVLQSEFFTLEEKTLSTIEQAIKKSIESVPETVTLSGCIAFLKDSIIYLYAFGGGQALLTRGGTTATLFKEEKDSPELTTVSGYLQSGDIILLATASFITSVPKTLLTESFTLQLPSDMAELLTPTLHKSEDGTPAATIITFASSESVTPKPAEPEDETEELPKEKKQLPEKQTHEIHPSLNQDSSGDVSDDALEEEKEILPVEEEEGETLADRIQEPVIIERDDDAEAVIKKSRFALPSFSFSFPKKNLFFLTIAIGIAAILIFTIVTTKQNQGDTKAHSAFVELYDEASKIYAEGEGLVSLNKSLAMDDFKKAKETLDKAKQYVKSGTDDEKKYTELAEKIDSQGIAPTEATKKVEITEAGNDSAPALQKELSENALAVSEDTSYVYTITNKTISQIDKGNDKAKILVTNDSDWTSPQAISVYLSNIYVLDKGINIVKFVAGSDGYGKSTYFKDTVPSLKNTISMSIDSSVYLLDSDGTIRKFSKGESETFTLSGLPSNLSNPKKLFTSTDTENLYVLDNGNSRVVKLDKTGAYISSYTADQIKSASDFIVSEKDKKIYLLIDKKVYQIAL